MGDLIIKPEAGGSIKLQNNAGTNALVSDNSGNITLGGSTTLTNATITAGTIASATTFPAGHIIGSNRIRYQYTGDITVDTTTTGEAFGPVVPLTLKKANAKIYATYNIDETYQNGTSILYFNVVYKSTSFTAGGGNNAHGGAYLHSTHSQYRDVNSIRKAITIHVFNESGLPNSAGDTYYFAPVGYTNTGTPGVNYYGNNSCIILNVMEVS